VFEPLARGLGPAQPRRRSRQLQLDIAHQSGALVPGAFRRSRPRVPGCGKHSAFDPASGFATAPLDPGGSGKRRAGGYSRSHPLGSDRLSIQRMPRWR
jgi:hypothetical protein